MNRNDLLLLAEAGSTNDEVTSMLIDMIVGTCIMRAAERKRIDPHDYNIDFAPADLNRMWMDYEVIRDETSVPGRTNFTLRRRVQEAPRLGVDNEEDTRNAAGQAVPKKHDREWWCVMENGQISMSSHSKDIATDMMLVCKHDSPDTICELQNRACLHDTCPAEVCTRAASA